jgi:hypothetical protein
MKTIAREADYIAALSESRSENFLESDELNVIPFEPLDSIWGSARRGDLNTAAPRADRACRFL